MTAQNNNYPTPATLTTTNDFGPGWYAILSSHELPKDKPLALQRFGLALVAFRTRTGVSVLLDRCPHRAVKLSNGSLSNDGIICPFHGLEFNQHGHCTHIPVQDADAVIPQALCATCYPVREQHGFLFLWWGAPGSDALPERLPTIDWFDAELTDCDGPYEHHAESNTGLSRNIENQLDWAHLPFVHKRSIGRFLKTKVKQMACTVTGQRLRMFPQGNPESFLELRLPNLWLNRIGPKSYVFLAFAPVSATRTKIYTRYYQGFFKVPVLKQLLGWVMGWSNLWILREDLRLVETHDTPISPPLDGSELLLPCDIAVIQYRRLRAGWQTPN